MKKKTKKKTKKKKKKKKKKKRTLKQKNIKRRIVFYGRLAVQLLRVRGFVSQLAFFINLQRAVIGPSATLTDR